MDRDAKLINNILSYCGSIEDILDEFNRDHEEFTKRSSFQFACSFCIEQIGHNAEMLDPKLREKYSDLNWDGMVGLRVDIAHFYEIQNIDVIWDTVTKKVPRIRKVCEKILYDLTKR